MSHRRFRLSTILTLGLAATISLTGCASLNLEDCPQGGVLGTNELGTARLRTSHYRIVLADSSAAAARVLPYALMSAYAYRLGPNCTDPGNKIRVSDERAIQLIKNLANTTDTSSPWIEQPAQELRDKLDDKKIGCEDDEGLMFHVWERKLANRKLVVIAFRGTSGGGDWIYGNLWWISRYFKSDNQLTRARQHAERIIAYYDAEAKAAAEERPRFVTTGHSLGGTLAQHAFYSFPTRIEQAIVFDSSAVTGFADVSRAEQIAACSCLPASLSNMGVHLEPESRILRVYQTYEILSDLRFFHKLFFVPERHVQELRFPFPESFNQIERHSMQTFSDNLYAASSDQLRYSGGPKWIASRDNTCTPRVIDAQRQSCQRQLEAQAISVCPQ